MFKLGRTDSTQECDICHEDKLGDPKIIIEESSHRNGHNIIFVHVGCLLQKIGKALSK